MKTLIMCDSFKGTMSSLEVNQTIAEVLNQKGYVTKEIAISDGGEGFLDAINQIVKDGKLIEVETFDAIRRKIKASFLYEEETSTAYFCLADSVGIIHLKNQELDAENASTYGLGVMIKEAILKYHVKNVVLGIGGSASTDAGSGLLEALGVKFFDEKHKQVTNLSNKKLELVSFLDITEFKKLICDVSFLTLSDVTNPLTGPTGAAFIFGPQKGASPLQVIQMDERLKHFAGLVKEQLNFDEEQSLGSGAAGGVGFAMHAFFNSKVVVGIDFILDKIHFQDLVKEYDLIITGEGAFDSQSLYGKVISGIIKYNPKNLNIVCGIKKEEIKEYPVYCVVPTVATSEESLAYPKESLIKLIKKIY